jgi:chorismate mutase
VTLDDLRQRIDEVDEELVRLLNERASCALRIGQVKKDMGLPMYQPEREAEVLRHVRAAAVVGRGPLGPDGIARVFERIIDEARGLELKAVRHPGGE